MSIPLSSAKKRKRPNEKRTCVNSSFNPLSEAPLPITPLGIASRIFIPIHWFSGSLQVFHLALAIPVGAVILAKLDDLRSFVCIERIQDQIFALCKLSEHVRIKDIQNVIKISSKCSVSVDEGVLNDDIAVGKHFKHCFTKRPILGLEKFMAEEDLCFPLVSFDGLRDKETNSVTLPVTLDGPEQVAEYLSLQYFEMLYINKTSLAYFVKSTFAKVRLAFKRLDESLSGSCRFAATPLYKSSLQGLLVPLQDMEQKYRDLKLFCKNIQDDIKLGVKGRELGYLEHWIEYDLRGIKEQVFAEKLVDQLKIREMQLQVLLLLEILAWSHEHPETNSPTHKNVEESTVENNCPSLRVDLCIDRLLLWHTLHSSSIAETLPQKEEEDFLKQFCLEIIIPFYESRIPEKCSSLYIKCGCNSTKKRKKSVVGEFPTTSRSSRKPKTTFKSIPPPKRRPTNHLSKLAAREIEFKPLKRKQPPNLTEDLRAAINNVAKPNRMAIGAEIMEDRERRLRKDSLQVPATPSNRRVRSQVGDSQDLPSPPFKKKRRVSSPIVVEDTPVKSLHYLNSQDIQESPTKCRLKIHNSTLESAKKRHSNTGEHFPQTTASEDGQVKEEPDIFD